MTTKVKSLTNSRKRQFSLGTRTTVCTDSYWDGGSKSDYTVINLDTGRWLTPPAGQYPWTTRNDYTLQPGDVVVETGMFCGKAAAPHFMCRPEDEERVLAWLGIPPTTIQAEDTVPPSLLEIETAMTQAARNGLM